MSLWTRFGWDQGFFLGDPDIVPKVEETLSEWFLTERYNQS